MRSFFVVIVLLLLVSCDTSRVFEDQRDFKDRVWAARDTTEFDFGIQDTGLPYHVYLTVRNSVDYPYSRLFVRYNLRDSIGNLIRSDLATSYLFDLKTGEPHGRSGLGDLYDHRLMLLENFQFEQPGKYRLQLVQYMRMDSLPGIVAVGARVENAKK